MKIDDLINRLQVIRSKYGNVEVHHDLDVGDEIVPVQRVDYYHRDDGNGPNMVVIV